VEQFAGDTKIESSNSGSSCSIMMRVVTV